MRRHDAQRPFLDIQGTTHRFTIPRLKWRELLFVGALVKDGDTYRRNPSRPLPSFRVTGLFPDEARFRVDEGGESSDRVQLVRVDVDRRPLPEGESLPPIDDA